MKSEKETYRQQYLQLTYQYYYLQLTPELSHTEDMPAFKATLSEQVATNHYEKW